MRGLRSCWPKGPAVVLILTLLSCYYSSLSEARKLHSSAAAVVVGTVYCDTCFQSDVSKAGAHYISGATVAVECQQGKSRPAFYQEAKTDTQGQFKVSLPFSVSKHVKQIQGCNVKLVKSSEPYCSVASTATSSDIHLKDKKGDQLIFSAGFFTFKPLKQPGLCNQQPSLTKSQMNSVSMPQIPPIPTIPTIPQIPGMPTIPNIPTIPKIPGVPSQTQTTPKQLTEKTSKEDKQVVQPQQFFPFPPPIIGPPPSGLLPPNPLQPAPLVPIPFQPPAPPFIPIPLQPPAPPPGLIPPLPPLPQLPPMPNLPVPPLPNLPVPGLNPPPVVAPAPPLVPYLPVPIPGLNPPPVVAPAPPTLPIPQVPILPPLAPGLGLPIPPVTSKTKEGGAP